MSDIFFCKICIYPSSKPHIEFNDDGICSGCIAYQRRPNIDWKEREIKFKSILENNKKKIPTITIVLCLVVGEKIVIIKLLKCLSME